MFEKEAEERAERKISNFIPQQWGVILIRTEQTYETVEGAPHFYLRSLAKMWKEGAEYGYNKAKIEVEDSYRESLCNAELNLASVTEQLEELEKEYASLKGLRKYELNVAKLEIEKLEKENAELRTKTTALENANRAMVKELDDMTSGGVSVLENVVRSKEQLTKAKKIIKNLMVFAEIDSREYEKEYKEAEQFLKEVSE